MVSYINDSTGISFKFEVDEFYIFNESHIDDITYMGDTHCENIMNIIFQEAYREIIIDDIFSELCDELCDDDYECITSIKGLPTSINNIIESYNNDIYNEKVIEINYINNFIDDNLHEIIDSYVTNDFYDPEYIEEYIYPNYQKLLLSLSEERGFDLNDIIADKNLDKKLIYENISNQIYEELENKIILFKEIALKIFI